MAIKLDQVVSIQTPETNLMEAFGVKKEESSSGAEQKTEPQKKKVIKKTENANVERIRKNVEACSKFTCSLPNSIQNELVKYAYSLNKSKSLIISEALNKYFKENKID